FRRVLFRSVVSLGYASSNASRRALGLASCSIHSSLLNTGRSGWKRCVFANIVLKFSASLVIETMLSIIMGYRSKTLLYISGNCSLIWLITIAVFLALESFKIGRAHV